MIQNTLFILLLTSFSLSVHAQATLADTIKALLDQKKYDLVIQQYGNSSQDMSARAIYQVGLAYYMKEDDSNCLKWMDLAIQKDSMYGAPHRTKGSVYGYMGKFDNAIACYQTAIRIHPDGPEAYVGLGDVYNQQDNTKLALEAYLKAVSKPNCPDRPYTLIGQLYSDLNESKKALEAFYVARDKVSKTSKSYKIALYNIGLLEMLQDRHERAEPALLELVQLAPKDYQTYAKLIQVYYHTKAYEKAKPYRDKLYEAYAEGTLTEHMKDMFCFDQFKWGDKTIQAYERYETEGKNDLFMKHIFYVVNQKDEVEYRIQTEYSAISVELGSVKYLLCMTKGKTHSTFNVGFNDDFSYEDMKAAVIDVLEGKLKPMASSTTDK